MNIKPTTTYTVIGLHEDDGTVLRQKLKARDAYEAMQIVANKFNGDKQLVILGAIVGDVHLMTPGDDNYKTAYACDLTS